MKGYRKNHWYFIIFIFGFALYNVLPTCFYYARSSSQEFDCRESQRLIGNIVSKVEKTHKDALERVRHVAKEIRVKPKEIKRSNSVSGVIEVYFRDKEEATLFAEKVSLSERSVPFVSQKLRVINIAEKAQGACVQVAPAILEPLSLQDFSFSSKKLVPAEYQQQVLRVANDVAAKVFREKERLSCCGYPSPFASSQAQVYALSLAKTFAEYRCHLSDAVFLRCVAFYLREPKELEDFTVQLDNIVRNSETSKEDQKVCSEILSKLRQSKKLFCEDPIAITSKHYDCSKKHPLFQSVEVSFSQGQIFFNYAEDIFQILNPQNASQKDLNKAAFLNQMLLQEKHRIAESTGLVVTEGDKGLIVSLFSSPEVNTNVIFHGERSLEAYKKHILGLIVENWKPQSTDFSRSVFSVSDLAPSEQDAFGCFVFYPKESCKHFRKGRVYVVLKGINAVVEKYRQAEDGEEKRVFDEDITSLLRCFYHLDVSVGSVGEDRIFEIKAPFAAIIDASEEDFTVCEDSACLDLTTVQQYLAKKTQIETSRQKELLLWKERYQRAKCSGDFQENLYASAPHRSVFYENCKLNFKKYCRGDQALRWGVDLAGGKHIKLAFKDHQGRLVSDKEELSRIYDELYARLNKLGVSEIEMHREGNNIHLSIPGCSSLSAKEILGFSSMTFHVVNEKFAPSGSCGAKANVFLDYLRYRSLAENKTSSEEVTALAEQMFSGDVIVPNTIAPVIEELKTAGLKFSGGLSLESGEVDEQFSAIVTAKDVDESINPLVIVFKVPALEGSALSNISTDFSANEGYSLNFFVRKNLLRRNGENSNPTEILHKWTSTFCKESIQNTPRSAETRGRGWRMAAVINGEGISFPALNAPLRDSARVTGNFSYNEITRLANDLKAGTLSCSPEILSEETIAPELGKTQRMKGLVSAAVGIVLLISLMCVYYRFGGVIASIAVVLNLILIWAALQYMGASMTLSGLAGVVLAMGMAVDANVLVFERVKEEYSSGGSLFSSLEMGYKRAFGAIFDSNLTTVLAAFLLFFMDTGPIKGFALTLILGIFSSMFTSLFMTKFFFSIWMEKTGRKELNMMSNFSQVHHNFLGNSRKAWTASVCILLGGFASLFFGAMQTLPGIDFKGGYSFSLDPTESTVHLAATSSFSEEIGKRLIASGMSSRDFRIKTFGDTQKIRVYLSTCSLEKIKNIDTKNPVDIAKDLLQRAGVLEANNAKVIEKEWSQVSGQFSTHMCRQAVIGLASALVIILCYIAFRFEWRFACSAVLALVHDLVATCSVLAITHFFLKKVQLDLQAVGALMTVLGYSLNNTLIVFDRIREDSRKGNTLSLKALVENALQGTFSRTVMTTATTLSVLLVLLFLGGGAIFNFAFIMTVGIILGTLSSLYIAPPLLLFMLQKRVKA